MNIHYIQHVEFETPGTILDWAKQKNHKVSSTKFYLNEQLPNKMNFDLLVVMGGPMSIYDIENYQFLIQEKAFIKNAIEQNKFLLGICLGAQLIADVLGAKVKQNMEKEIGWFPIKSISNNCESELNNILATENSVFHWHGDTFEIPKGAKRLAQSDVCENQAFIYNKNVIGLQYHLEMTASTLTTLIENCRDELTDAPYVQSEEEMMKAENNFSLAKAKLFSLLDYIEKQFYSTIS